MDLMANEAFALGLIRYVIFLFSTTCHEASHALAAKLGGDPTAFHGGQVTLNPVPHVRREPFGMVFVPLLSLMFGGGLIGWASAPFDPFWQQRHPRRAAWMSLAGPVANFTLALIALLSMWGGLWTGAFLPPDRLNSLNLVESATPGLMAGIAKFLSILFSMNLLLGTFNLLPVPPLDGFSVLALFMSERTAQRFNAWGMQMRAYSFIGLLVCWKLFDQIYGPVFNLGIKILHPSLIYG